MSLEPKAVSALMSAVDFFRLSYRIPVSALLPYDMMLVPFAYWFYHQTYSPTGRAMMRMQEFFWRAALSNRYSASTESKLAADARRVDEIINGNNGAWDDLTDGDLRIDSAEKLIGTNFATGNSICKAILCLLAYKQPKNFDDNGLVNLDNSYLKIASSKNYHHFFPRAHLARVGIGNENSIVNITLIGADLNKRKIRARAPKDYIADFEADFGDDKSKMAESLESHLIQREGMGVDEDNYALFLNERADKLWKMISERIYPAQTAAPPTVPPSLGLSAG